MAEFPSLQKTFKVERVINKLREVARVTDSELKQILKENLYLLSPEERLAGLTVEERLAGLKPEERLAGLKPEELKELIREAEEKLKKVRQEKLENAS